MSFSIEDTTYTTIIAELSSLKPYLHDLDIFSGYLIVNTLLMDIHPSEFIYLTFQQEIV
jgi:hypothetical protein